MSILKSLNQRPIAYYPIYREITGSTTAGILLSQLMYWFSKKDKFHKTDIDIMSETLLTKKELETAKKKIKSIDFITITREGLPSKTFYEINWTQYEITLKNLIAQKELEEDSKFPQIGESEQTEEYTGNQDSPNGGNCDNGNGATRFPDLGNMYSPIGGYSTPLIGEAIYNKIKETTTKTTTKNTLSPLPSLMGEGEKPQGTKSEREFLNFINTIRELYSSKGNFYPILFKNGEDLISVSAKGFLYIKNTGNDLSPSQAKVVWEYLYKNQDKIQHIEPQILQHRQNSIDRVHCSSLDSTNYIRSNT